MDGELGIGNWELGIGVANYREILDMRLVWGIVHQ
jgi:hypothetical protein